MNPVTRMKEAADFYSELESSLAGSTEAQRKAWATLLVEQNGDLKQLSGLLRCDRKTATRFLWMLSGVGIMNPGKLYEALPFLLEYVEAINPAYLTSFANYWLIAGVPPQNEGKAIDLSFEWLISAETNVTIKSRAAFVLLKLTRKYPELKNELRFCLEDQMDKYSKDFKKRAVKNLKDLEE
ncbi:hypothetical protein [Fluviicola chungangensis]|uniref:HEAT repeat domain-containing protein n=1 Tax=Fluviicola chungangensis TaxID=2597671 RepID=A0A556N7G5_9FLAO|nr:hypothetical protein [Fluviicola chungangensis]TSJ47969.1 hypothetical protein FO442_02215 [Fluviicola chungangensis]